MVFAYAGASIGAALGGLVLGAYGFVLVGIIFGSLNVIASMIVLIFVRDPNKL
jgi:predicted MFS family arabinose efflux permease